MWICVLVNLKEDQFFTVFLALLPALLRMVTIATSLNVFSFLFFLTFGLYVGSFPSVIIPPTNCCTLFFTCWSPGWDCGVSLWSVWLQHRCLLQVYFSSAEVSKPDFLLNGLFKSFPVTSWMNCSIESLGFLRWLFNHFPVLLTFCIDCSITANVKTLGLV